MGGAGEFIFKSIIIFIMISLPGSGALTSKFVYIYLETNEKRSAAAA